MPEDGQADDSDCYEVRTADDVGCWNDTLEDEVRSFMKYSRITNSAVPVDKRVGEVISKKEWKRS